GTTEFGVKTELKNINSFRALHRAVEYEINRQIEQLESGGEVVQETRGWSEAGQRTFSQRGKEAANDYRYFPEPDLPPLQIDPQWVEGLRALLPELPHNRRRRLVQEHGVTAYDAEQLTMEAATANLFEQTVEAGAPAKQAANWIIGQNPQIAAVDLAELINLVATGEINREQGLAVLAKAQASHRRPREIVEREGMSQVSDQAALVAVVEQVMIDHPQAVTDFKGGKQQAMGALMAAVKAASGGRANMKLVGELLRSRLSGS
ncbi:MAG: Asp-tRNA(Asn)/Glu-tRNA(Gln) amidotransferase subunit GatB, partial [Candidatus Dormibacteraceae bacterium]